MSKAPKFTLIMILVPCLLSALETVNLVKNHSYEIKDYQWETYKGATKPIDNDSAEANAHDEVSAFHGSFSASVETRSRPGDPNPPSILRDSAVVIGGFTFETSLKDLDEFKWAMKLLPKSYDYDSFCVVKISLIFDAEDEFWWSVYYEFVNSKYLPGSPDGPHSKYFTLDLPNDTLWGEWDRSLHEDLIEKKGLPPESVIDSIGFVGYGTADPMWLGQKVYWDDIRLMGYADYDVGVKKILSGDSLEIGEAYQPEARIKNFGREPADTFLAMAEIWDGTNLIYADTIPYSLPPDTSEVITFADFVPSATGPYTLTIRTHMEPDESDADDELSKPIGKESVAEEPILENLSLDVHSFASPLRVSYALPFEESGTLTIYEATGRRVERLTVNGSGSLEFSKNLSSGVYLVQLQSKGRRVTGKAIIL